jgi:hypothetical protein
MDEETRTAFTTAHRKMGELQQDVDGLSRQVTRLVDQLDQDDELADRTHRVEREERDQHRRMLNETLIVLGAQMKDLQARVENMGQAMRDLPTRVLAKVEKEVYKLRIARWEANQPPKADEPMPLPPPQRGDPTGRITVPQGVPIVDDHSASLALTPAQQRGLWKAAKDVVTHKLLHIPYAVGAWEAIKHVWDWAQAALRASGH